MRPSKTSFIVGTSPAKHLQMPGTPASALQAVTTTIIRLASEAPPRPAPDQLPRREAYQRTTHEPGVMRQETETGQSLTLATRFAA